MNSIETKQEALDPKKIALDSYMLRNELAEPEEIGILQHFVIDRITLDFRLHILQLVGSKGAQFFGIMVFEETQKYITPGEDSLGEFILKAVQKEPKAGAKIEEITDDTLTLKSPLYPDWEFEVEGYSGD